MLKTKVQVAKVGDVIRSLDFPGRIDCYMIGIVTSVDAEVITCKGVSRAWEGRSEIYRDEFTTVQEGYHFLDKNFPGRISVL